MSKELAALIAKKFIQRRDVKAVQFSSGAYSPDRELKNPGRYAPMGFKMKHLLDHLQGTHTYGHYLLDQNDKCRLFAFDIDLEKTGSYIDLPPFDGIDPDISDEDFEKLCAPVECNPRELWADRAAKKARNWYKYQMNLLAQRLCATISQMDIPCAAAYSGAKGVHVYGFTGEMPASEVRAAAEVAIELFGELEPVKGRNFFHHKNQDPFHGFPSFSIEVFPKQDSLDSKDLGNLMRLPLGRNLKSNDPTFFLDFSAPLGQLTPHKEPAKLLESGDPFYA